MEKSKSKNARANTRSKGNTGQHDAFWTWLDRTVNASTVVYSCALLLPTILVSLVSWFDQQSIAFTVVAGLATAAIIAVAIRAIFHRSIKAKEAIVAGVVIAAITGVCWATSQWTAQQKGIHRDNSKSNQIDSTFGL